MVDDEIESLLGYCDKKNFPFDLFIYYLNNN